MWQLVITIVKMSAVPLTAFLLRMYKGEVHNPNEQIISEAIRALVVWITRGKGKPA